MTEVEEEQPVANQPPIEDYAVIGNCHTAALISRAGSLDWWCPMRFDRPAVFAALLDPRRGGRFQVGPTAPYEVRRQYVEDTNVLETTFQTQTGQLRLTDLMPLGAATSNSRDLTPPHAILRAVECVAGSVEVELVCTPRFDYGSVTPSFRKQGAHLVYAAHGGEALGLRSELPLRVEDDGRVTGRVTLQQGERRFTGLTHAQGEPLILSPLGIGAEALIEETVQWWKRWTKTCTYDGPHREEVRRSALVLKLMTYAPSGAVVAAPTTSLPESIGGERNWDYRYCWLRDASLTMRALLDLGYREEGRAFLAWLLHATHLTWPRLQVLYDVFGRTETEEHRLDHLAGYRDSRPVRVGNAAADQLQLDIYGEVIGAAHEFIMRGGRLARRQVQSLSELGEVVCEAWQQPDDGIWEARSGAQHHTFSKVMCWRTLDGLLTMHEHGHLEVPAKRFGQVRDQIQAAVEERGYSKEIESYVQAFGNQAADASLLLLPVQGYCAPGDERMQSTYAFLEKKLATGSLWRRYRSDTDDGVSGSEAAFGICGFWAVEYLARAGRREAAAHAFERLLSYANDVGLFAEEIDPDNGAALGNFPQAFTHVGLINAALAIEGIPQEREHPPAAAST